MSWAVPKRFSWASQEVSHACWQSPLSLPDATGTLSIAPPCCLSAPAHGAKLPGAAPAPLGLPCSNQAVGASSLGAVAACGDGRLAHQWPERGASWPPSHGSCSALPTISSWELHAAAKGFSCRPCCHRHPSCVKAVEISLSCWVVLTHQAVSGWVYLPINKLACITFICA